MLRGLLRGNNSDRETYLNLAQVEERGRRYPEAEKAAMTAEQMSDKQADKETAWFMLGAIYERQKKFDQAEEEFRKVLQVNPRNAAVLNYYGYMLADRGIRLDEATAMIKRAVAEEPTNGAYLDSLGWAYYKQNKLAEAEEYLRKAVERDRPRPHHPRTIWATLCQDGTAERAAALWEKSLVEWQKRLPADFEADKVTNSTQKLKIAEAARGAKVQDRREQTAVNSLSHDEIRCAFRRLRKLIFACTFWEAPRRLSRAAHDLSVDLPARYARMSLVSRPGIRCRNGRCRIAHGTRKSGVARAASVAQRDRNARRSARASGQADSGGARTGRRIERRRSGADRHCCG